MNSNQTLPLRQAHDLIRDLMTPVPWIYWSDFLFHVSLGWIAFFLTLYEPMFSTWQILTFFIGTFSLYRAATFTHELTHREQGTFKLFRLVWNCVCGIPLLIPSFTYDGTHNDHHRLDIYGTDKDGEYLPFATKEPKKMFLYALSSFALPLFFIIRFSFLVPLSYLIPSLRKNLWERASSLIINLNYKRRKDSIRHDKNWQVQEFSTFIFASVILICTLLNILSYKMLVLWYMTGAFIFFLNSLRTLSAHAYRNPNGEKMDFFEQYLDSIDLTSKSPLSELFAPVGLRYHATHHLFMNLPYHNLAEAQRRLISGLGDTLPSSKVMRNNLLDALRGIWREASAYTFRGKNIYSINQKLKVDKLHMGTAVIGLLQNPLSGQGKHHNDSLLHFNRIIPGLIVRDARNLLEFKTSIDAFLSAKIDVLIIVAGDGTTHAILTHLLNSCPLAEWPILAVLPGGTTNMTALDMVNSDDLKKSLTGLSKALLRNVPLSFTERHLLSVEQENQARKCGMFFSAGLIARIVIFSRGRIKGMGVTGEIYSIISVIFYFILNIYTLNFKKTINKPTKIFIKEQEFQGDASQVLLISSLNRLLFNMHPFWGKEKNFCRVTFSTKKSRKPFYAILKVLLNSKDLDVSKFGYHSFNNNEVRLLMNDSYIIDGEPYQARIQDGQLSIKAVGPTTFLTW